MILLVTGDRHWKDERKIATEIFKRRNKIDFLIVGGARGADSIAENRAMLLGIPVIRIDANWSFYRRAAGPIRNGWMLDVLLALTPKKKPRIRKVLAFHSNIKKSKGTANMVRQAKDAGIKVQIIK